MKPLSSAEAALFRAAGTLTSTVGRGGRGLLVLIYHRVLDAPDAMWPDTIRAPQFAAQMDLLAECFNVLPLSEALARLQSRSLPRQFRVRSLGWRTATCSGFGWGRSTA